MAFLIHSTTDGHMPAWEYMQAAAITPKVGLALVANASGQLAIASGTTKPTHVCMRDEAAAVAAGTIIPVIAITPDITFEVNNNASMANAKVGTAVTIHTDGLSVTNTTTEGTATIVKVVDPASTTGTTLVKFN